MKTAQRHAPGSLRGIALVEALMGITILILGLGAATTLALQLLKGTTLTKQEVVATSLAREAIEAVRNVRDTNWQSNSGSQRDASSATREHWNDGFKDAYLVAGGADYVPILDSSSCDVAGPIPCPTSRWRLLDLNVAHTQDLTFVTAGCDASLTTTELRTQLREDTTTGALSNVCTIPGVSPPTPTRYRRWIHVNYLDPVTNQIAWTGTPTADPTKEVWVEVVVQWYGSADTTTWATTEPSEIRLSTTLTDWFGRKTKN